MMKYITYMLSNITLFCCSLDRSWLLLNDLGHGNDINHANQSMFHCTTRPGLYRTNGSFPPYVEACCQPGSRRRQKLSTGHEIFETSESHQAMEILQKAHFSPEDVEADEVLVITPVKHLRAVRSGISI